MITVQLDPETDEVVELALDTDGLTRMLDALGWLRDQQTDHFHLFSSTWSDPTGDLGEAPLREGARIVHHLKVQLVDTGAM